ncbi:MAG: nucleoside hydrolase, partial [Steroidobacteraceae bacterium]|nr:nucleoside hydrolase [Steroidobacteraceae bacterium]
HQVLSPKARTVLITTTALDPKFPGPIPAERTAEAGRQFAEELLRRTGVASITVIAGPARLDPAAPSAAAQAIVQEALRDDPLPLFLTCGGPLTNVAAALRLEPAIARRMTVVWIGGGAYPAGGWEYNLAADPEAARAVIENSTVPFWQVPQDVYRQMQYSIAALRASLRPISPLTRWLYARFTNPPEFVTLSGAWPLGDSPLVLLTTITTESSAYEDRAAQRILPDLAYGDAIAGRGIRVYRTVDARLTFDDMLALLHLQRQRR